VFSDLGRYRSGARPNWPAVLSRCLVEPGMIASIILRAQQRLYQRGHRRAAAVLRTVGVVLVGAEFVPGAAVGAGLFLPHPVGVVLGNRSVVGCNVTIAQGVTIGARVPDATLEQGYPTIGDGAILLARSTVVGGVHVGAHAQISANSLVTTDVAEFAVMLGVPATQIRTRELEAATSNLLPPSARPGGNT